MKTIGTILVVLLAVVGMTMPVLGSTSSASGYGIATIEGALVTAGAESASGDASASAGSFALGDNVYASASSTGGLIGDELCECASAQTNAGGLLSKSWGDASVDNDLGEVSVYLEAGALDGNTGVGTASIVDEDQITAMGGADAEGLVATTGLDVNNAYAEINDEDAIAEAQMDSFAVGGITHVEIDTTGGEGWVNIDGTSWAIPGYTGTEAIAIVTEE